MSLSPAEAAACRSPSVMWLEWHDGRISFIHDYRHARHVVADAEWVLTV